MRPWKLEKEWIFLSFFHMNLLDFVVTSDFAGSAAVWTHTPVGCKAAKINHSAEPLTGSNLHVPHPAEIAAISPLCTINLRVNRETKPKHDPACKFCTCMQLRLCHVRIACDCFPLHACVFALTPWPFLKWRFLLFYPGHGASPCPGSSAGQRSTNPPPPLFLCHASQLYSWNVALVEITRRKNANASGTTIPQQLRDSQPRQTWHDRKLKDTHTRPTHSLNGIFCLRFFIYSIKLLVFCSFHEAAELELGQNKHIKHVQEVERG